MLSDPPQPQLTPIQPENCSGLAMFALKQGFLYSTVTELVLTEAAAVPPWDHPGLEVLLWILRANS